MKKYTILGHVFELEDQAHHFLVRYIERIEQYAKDHAITQDVVDDLKYNIIEKLYRHDTPITEKQVIEIANTLGEPEVMFDEDEAAKTWFNVNFWKMNFDKGRLGIIDREKPVIRGVCYRLAKSLNIEVRIVRIAFILLTLLNGVGIILYIVLALFAPYRDKKKTTGRLGNFIFEVVRIAFWAVVIMILFPLVAGALFGTGILFFTPEMNNQSFTEWIPQYIYGTWAAVAVSLLALLIGAVGALLKQRRLNKTLALLATIVVIGGMVVVGWTAYRTAILVSDNKITLDQSFTFTGDAKETTGTVVLDMNNLAGDDQEFNLDNLIDTKVQLIPASWNDIHISVETLLRGIGETQLKQAADALTPLQVMQNANSIVFASTWNTFGQKVPFTITRRSITISLPTTKEVVLLRSNDNDIDLSQMNQYSQYPENGEYGQRDHGKFRLGFCEDDVYIYNTAQQRFTCKNVVGR